MVWHQRGLLIRLVADDKSQVELGLCQSRGTREQVSVKRSCQGPEGRGTQQGPTHLLECRPRATSSCA